jgi:hypothetical protein
MTRCVQSDNVKVVTARSLSCKDKKEQKGKELQNF